MCMAKKRTLDAELYVLSHRANVILDGFAFVATNNACIEEDSDGNLVATRFGLSQIGAITASNIQDDEDCFETVNKDATVTLFEDDRGTMYIPLHDSDLTPMVRVSEPFALYDKSTETVYEAETEKMEEHSVNLVGAGVRTVKKVTDDELKSDIGDRYIPLAKIEG